MTGKKKKNANVAEVLLLLSVVLSHWPREKCWSNMEELENLFFNIYFC